MTGEIFQLKECFCTFSLIMVFSSLNSPLKYYTVQLINVSCFGAFYFVMLLRFGFYHIKWDFYHNLIISLALIAFIHRQKEGLLRSNYINNSVYQMRERKWKNILQQLSEGILILEAKPDQKTPRVLFSNDQLQKMLNEKQRVQMSKKESTEPLNMILEQK